LAAGDSAKGHDVDGTYNTRSCSATVRLCLYAYRRPVATSMSDMSSVKRDLDRSLVRRPFVNISRSELSCCSRLWTVSSQLNQDRVERVQLVGESGEKLRPLLDGQVQLTRHFCDFADEGDEPGDGGGDAERIHAVWVGGRPGRLAAGRDVRLGSCCDGLCGC